MIRLNLFYLINQKFSKSFYDLFREKSKKTYYSYLDCVLDCSYVTLSFKPPYIQIFAKKK